MKKLSFSLLSLLLCLALVVSFAACDKDDPDVQPNADTTAAKADGTSEPATDNATTPEESQAPDAEETTAEAPSEETTAASGEQDTTEGEVEYDPETYIVIRTAEDLMELNAKVNDLESDYDCWDKTIIFLNDIDMTGYTWTPMNGYAFDYTTFDGQGHTISNLTFAEHNVEKGTSAENIGSGFIGIATGSMTFRDITFDNCSVVAHERAVACIIGLNYAQGGYTDFENVTVKNFTAEGWMDYNNQDTANGGYPISFRVAGYVGHNLSGSLVFTNCRAENLKLSGFHNLAAFIGYEGTNTIDAYSFENCHVENAEMTFSYCLSDAYTADQPRKFVSVFYNQSNWVESIQPCVDNGNTFTNISFYDFTDDNAEYTPSDFLSWSYEEAYPNG